ncbi:hypothetical protein FRB95_009153 [Tulasnella sp. JGI-2019a]|nr:hypothetical protein FRB95_009153 [Tulasnella sp. JGI-2019a]
MGTYADEWNRTYGGPRAAGPTVIIVDGIHEENAEVEEKMELDNGALIDVSLAVDRIQSQRNTWKAHEYGTDWQIAMDIEIDMGDTTGSITAILDTNVLVSYIHLIRELVNQQLQQNNYEVLLVIPGIVIQELDGLRARKGGVSNAARRTNDWLLPRVNRTPCLRGQKTSESPRGNWMYNRDGLHNDDLVLECAEYYMKLYGLSQDRVKVITCDKNLQLKANIEGYATVSPGPVWDVQELLRHLGCGLQPTPPISLADSQKTFSTTKEQLSGSASNHIPSNNDQMLLDDHAPGCSKLSPTPPIGTATKKRSRNSKHSPSVDPSVEPAVAKIICDPDLLILPPHPLNQLQDQLRAYLSHEIPTLMKDGIEQVRRQQQRQAEQDKKISIHARPMRPPPIILPAGDEWPQWSVEESLLWIDRAVLATQNPSVPGTSGKKLADLIIPYGERGGRKGESWGRGDWDSAANALERIFGGTAAGDFRRAVEQAFISGSRR